MACRSAGRRAPAHRLRLGLVELTLESLLGRRVAVETSTEIVAKKICYRAEQFAARDLFDVALVAEYEPEALRSIKPVLEGRRDAILRRLGSHEAALREAFAALEVLDYPRDFGECVALVIEAFG